MATPREIMAQMIARFLAESDPPYPADVLDFGAIMQWLHTLRDRGWSQRGYIDLAIDYLYVRGLTEEPSGEVRRWQAYGAILQRQREERARKATRRRAA